MENNLNKEKRNNYKVLDALKVFFYVLVINLLISLAYSFFMLIISFFYKGTFKELLNTPFAFYVAIIVTPLAFIGCFLAYNKFNNINTHNAIAPTKKFNWLSLVIVIVISGLVIVGFMPIISMVLNALEKLGLNTSGGNVYNMDSPIRIILGLFAYAVLPAFAEELLFRGIIFKGLSRKAKPIASVLLSSLMFCLMHGGIQQTFYQFLLGVILALIMYYTGNIVFSMIFHFVNNLVVVILELTGGFNSFLSGFSQTFGGYMAGIGVAIGVSAVVVLLLWLLKKLNKNESDQFIVEGGNIIIDDKDEKLDTGNFVSSFDLNEKFYFYSSMVIAIIIWITNSF